MGGQNTNKALIAAGYFNSHCCGNTGLLIRMTRVALKCPLITGNIAYISGHLLIIYLSNFY